MHPREAPIPDATTVDVAGPTVLCRRNSEDLEKRNLNVDNPVLRLDPNFIIYY